MGNIQQKWQEQQSRIEDGIFFGSDECVTIVGAPDTGYKVETRKPAASIIASAPDGWCHLIETVTAQDQSGGLSIHAGETSWEGGGFIAVVTASTGQLLWLLHCSASESFAQVVTDGESIRAVSGRYPMRYEWCIPIHAPEKFSVESFRVA